MQDSVIAPLKIALLRRKIATLSRSADYSKGAVASWPQL